MEIIYNTKNQWQQKYLTSKTFIKLYELFSIKEDYILRELKKYFTKEDKIETKLEDLIEHQIIKRENRRYFLCLPNLYLHENRTAIEEWVTLLMRELQGKTLQEQLSMLILLIDNQTEFSPFLLPEKTNFAFFNKLGNDLGVVYSLSLKKDAFNLPNYFLEQRQPIKQNQFLELEQLIGDVNPSYYLDQSFVILEKILNKRHRIRASIFTESLKMMEIIKENERYHINVPIVNQLVNSYSHTAILRDFLKLDYYLQRRIIGEILFKLKLKNETLIQINSMSEI